MVDARTMWRTLEPLHAVLYYAPEVSEAAAALGYETGDRWSSYFPLRAAPLGCASPELVTAVFYGFAPNMVRRHVARAWETASPTAILEAREAGVAAALRRILGEEVAGSPDLLEAVGLAERAAGSADLGGRPLAAANVGLVTGAAASADPVVRLWRAVTILREHRGDGHVAALLGAGLDPAESLAQLASDSDVPEDRFASRGWTDEEWEGAFGRLAARGWVEGRTATPVGRRGRDALERRTDELAATPWTGLGDEGTRRLAALVGPWSRAIAASGLLPATGTLALSRTVGAEA